MFMFLTPYFYAKKLKVSQIIGLKSSQSRSSLSAAFPVLDELFQSQTSVAQGVNHQDG